MAKTAKRRNRKNLQKHVVTLYQNGTTNPHELAEAFAITPEYVSKLLSLAGVQHKRPAQNYKHCELTKLMEKELQAGEKQSVIAKKYGVSRQWVSELKKKGEKHAKKQEDERAEA